MTAKPERIGYRRVNSPVLRFVKGEVQIIINLRVFIARRMVDGRRYDVIVNGQDTCHRFHRARRPKHVT